MNPTNSLCLQNIKFWNVKTTCIYVGSRSNCYPCLLRICPVFGITIISVSICYGCESIPNKFLVQLWTTVICRCINTPVKRQYINALFEMVVYHRKRVATIINFLSFISIDIKGFPFNFGRKIFTGFEMTELESWSISFFDILCSKIVEKCGSVTFKI